MLAGGLDGFGVAERDGSAADGEAVGEAGAEAEGVGVGAGLVVVTVGTALAEDGGGWPPTCADEPPQPAIAGIAKVAAARSTAAIRVLGRPFTVRQ